MKLLVTMLTLLSGPGAALAEDAAWREEYRSSQAPAPPGLPEEAREALREAIGSLMQMHAPVGLDVPTAPEGGDNTSQARADAIHAKKRERDGVFLRAVNRLPDVVPPGYQADEGRGLEEKLIAIARHKRERPELYEQIQRKILYNRARTEFEPGQMPRGGPRAPGAPPEMRTEDYRLAWEFYVLTPIAPPPPTGTDPSRFFPLSGWRARAESAVASYQDARSIPTFLALFERSIAPGVKLVRGELSGPGLDWHSAVAQLSNLRPECFAGLLECQRLAAERILREGEPPPFVWADSDPPANSLGVDPLEYIRLSNIKFKAADEWKAFVESIQRGSIPPRLLPYYDEHLKKVRETKIDSQKDRKSDGNGSKAPE